MENVNGVPEPVPDRPWMGVGYGISQDGDGTANLPWSEVMAWFTTSRSYWLATTRSDGRPHVMPVWGVVIGGVLLFSTSRDSRKGRNLAERPECVIHLESGDDVLILEGIVEEFRDPLALEKYVEAYETKYQFRPDPSDPGSSTYALRPKVGFSWREVAFEASATRWRWR